MDIELKHKIIQFILLNIQFSQKITISQFVKKFSHSACSFQLKAINYEKASILPLYNIRDTNERDMPVREKMTK